MKKFLSIFLSLVLIIFQIDTIKVSADTTYQSGGYTYSVSDSTAVITSYTGSGNITIPGTINGYTVTGIGDNAFKSCYYLTGVTIPGSVTSIGDYAFSNCDRLTSITIPNSVTSIGDYAFFGCTSLTSITLPSNLSRIGNWVFSWCTSLTSITIPSSVTSIGYNAFGVCCMLTRVTIPSSVTSIGDYAFESCMGLTSITIPNSVTSIGHDAFSCCSFTSITIQNSVTSIGDNAFDNCKNLTSITIPSNVTSIGNNAFNRCPSNLIIYYDNKTIGFTNPWNGCKTVPYNIISYDGNGNTGGTIPIDNNIYIQGTKAAILKNTGNLVKMGYIFAGWNTAKDGSGISYSANSLILMNGTDITLYAQWVSISPSTGTFTKAAPTNLTAAITAPNKTSNPIIGVYNGDTKLVGGTDEAIVPTTTGYTLTLYKSYLSKLTSNAVITVKFKNGSLLNYTVTLSTTSISPTAGTFTKTAPTNLITAITAPNKTVNPIIGVYNGDTKLIGGTDEAVAPTTTGYTLTLYKSYLSKLISSTVITLKFKDGSSINYTVNVK